MDEIDYFLNQLSGIYYKILTIGNSYSIMVLNNLLGNHKMLNKCRLTRYPLNFSSFSNSVLYYFIAIDPEQSLQLISFIFISKIDEIKNHFPFLIELFQTNQITFPKYIIVDNGFDLKIFSEIFPNSLLGLSKVGLQAELKKLPNYIPILNLYFANLYSKTLLIQQLQQIGFNNSLFLFNSLFEKDTFLQLNEIFLSSDSSYYRTLVGTAVETEYESLFDQKSNSLENLIHIFIRRMYHGVYNLLKNSQISFIIQNRMEKLCNLKILNIQDADKLGNKTINDLWLQYQCFMAQLPCNYQWPMKNYYEKFIIQDKSNEFILSLNDFNEECLKFNYSNDIIEKLKIPFIIPKDINHKALKSYIYKAVNQFDEKVFKTKSFKNDWLNFVENIKKLPSCNGCPETHPSKNVHY